MCEFATLQKTITCTKKSRKGEIKWHKAFVEVELLARKQKKKKRKRKKTPNENTICIQGGFISGDGTYSFHFPFLCLVFHGRILSMWVDCT